MNRSVKKDKRKKTEGINLRKKQIDFRKLAREKRGKNYD